VKQLLTRSMLLTGTTCILLWQATAPATGLPAFRQASGVCEALPPFNRTPFVQSTTIENLGAMTESMTTMLTITLLFVVASLC